MTSRVGAKPRTIADVVASVREAFDKSRHGNRAPEPEARPLPLPPADAPLPPVPYHERVPGEEG